jgi:hypothetical protein
VADFARDVSRETSLAKAVFYEGSGEAKCGNGNQQISHWSREMVDGFTVDGGRDSGRASEVAKGFFQVKHEPESDAPINMGESFVDDSVGLRASLSEKNNKLPILPPTISCKWAVRSDRAQNSRSEALNLIRNRKGRSLTQW